MEKLTTEKFTSEAIDFWKNLYQPFFTTIKFMHEQLENMIDLAMKEMIAIQQENHRMLREWAANWRKNRDDFYNSILNNITKIEETVTKKKNAA